MKVIEVNNLGKKIGSRWIIKGVSFFVEKGDIFGFLGRNGAGKSTTINILTGLVFPTEGNFSILGYHHVDDIKKRIGVMPDASNFYSDLNGIDHLLYFSKLKGIKTDKKELLQLMDKIGLRGHERKKVSKYSFGMKKKLSIAQALLGNCEILFLDEPTSGLDPESAIEIQRLIRQLCHEGKTIFMTSHNLYEVERLCNRIAIMNQGSIEKFGEIGTLRKLFRKKELLHVKLGEITENNFEIIRNDLIDCCFDIQFNQNYINFTIEDTSLIPKIIHYLSDKRFDIYEVKVEEASLEEIFLHGGE